VKFPFSVAVAIGIGLIVLAGYFLKAPVLISARTVLLEWATILAAVAVLVGIANLFTVHWGKMTSGKSSGIYSAILIVSLVLTLGIVGWFGIAHMYSMWLFNYIQLPVEGSLMALLAVILVLAGIRLLRRRSNMLSMVFIITAMVILLATGPLFGISVPGLGAALVDCPGACDGWRTRTIIRDWAGYRRDWTAYLNGQRSTIWG
jgi:hypothetical protein